MLFLNGIGESNDFIHHLSYSILKNSAKILLLKLIVLKVVCFTTFFAVNLVR